MFVGVKCLRIERNGVFIARRAVNGVGELWNALNSYYVSWLKCKDSILAQKWRKRELWERLNILKNSLHSLKPGTELYIETQDEIEECGAALSRCEKIIKEVKEDIADIESMTFITFDVSDIDGEPVNSITFEKLSECLTRLIVNL